jgi:menaquinone-dependent protoporphyrinogen oxidase
LSLPAEPRRLVANQEATAMKILVAYATRHGATKGIAERIATTLVQHHLEVTLSPIGDVGAIEGYGAFVIGSAAYVGGWLGEATSFVRRHEHELAGRPVWLFSSGPTGTETVDAKGRDPLVAAEPKEFKEFARTIRPRGQQVFYGAYDPDAAPAGFAERMMKGFMRLAPAARDALPKGDFRDWPAIEAWAETIARELEPAAAVTV